VLTPDGHNSRYLDGILFKPEEMKAALDKAGHNEIGRPIKTFQRVLLLCYDFDSETGTMKANVMKIIRTAGVVTVVALGAFIFFGGYLRPRRITLARAAEAAARNAQRQSAEDIASQVALGAPAKLGDGISTPGEIQA
jgi:hypothetical protein